MVLREDSGNVELVPKLVEAPMNFAEREIQGLCHLEGAFEAPLDCYHRKTVATDKVGPEARRQL